MKVAVFLTYNYSLKTWYNSGTLERELKIFKSLHENFNIEFVFFSYSDSSDKQFLRNYPEFKVVPLYTKIKKNKYFRFFSSLVVNKHILNEIKKCDIIHQHQLLGSWVSIIYKKRAKKPLLIRTGYDMHEFSKLNKESIYKRVFLFFITKISLHFSDIYTVATECDKKIIDPSRKKNKSKIRIRPNWIVDNYRKNFAGRDSFKILSVGRLEDQKNFESLVRLFDKNSKYMLKIIGEGTKKNELMKLIKKYKLRVEIVSNIKNEDLIDEMNNYTFYISSSKFEGNPKTILEAMSAGCVVIASDIKNHQEIIKHQRTGYLFDLDKINLNEVLDSLLSNTEMLNSLSSNAKDFVINNNHLSILTKNMNKDYLELI